MQSEHKDIVDTIIKATENGKKTISFSLDLDGTATYQKKANDCQHIFDDAFIPNGLANVLTSLRKDFNVQAFAITGRDLGFARDHLGLEGSGQFHAEMSDIVTGERTVVKPEHNLEPLASALEDIAKEHGGWIERKSHYVGIMQMSELNDTVKQKIDQAMKEHLPESHELGVLYRGDELEIGPKMTCKRDSIQDIMGPHPEIFKDTILVGVGDTPHIDGPMMDRCDIGIGVKNEMQTSCKTVFQIANAHALLDVFKGLHKELSKQEPQKQTCSIFKAKIA